MTRKNIFPAYEIFFSKKGFERSSEIVLRLSKKILRRFKFKSKDELAALTCDRKTPKFRRDQENTILRASRKFFTKKGFERPSEISLRLCKKIFSSFAAKLKDELAAVTGDRI